MEITNQVVYDYLSNLLDTSPVYPIGDKHKWVIFSDLHMGDGSSTDDFRSNADMFIRALEDYYLENEFGLILNGDVEELQRFAPQKIINSWTQVYKLFDQFRRQTQLLKIVGNHDLELAYHKDNPFSYPLEEGIRLNYRDQQDIFIFHGHQASKKFQKHNQLIGFTLKYFANPLGIRNYSVSHSSTKQYKIEKRVYQFSSTRKIASVIGHTHRPLFESLHKVDRLKYKIEQLCREYDLHKGNELQIQDTIKALKTDLRDYHKENNNFHYKSYVYNALFHVPCLFNSGCVIGKRGMTCIELVDGTISLVHWFDKKISKKYLQKSGYKPEQLKETDYYRMVINKEFLDYIFTRIKFLT